MRIMSSEDLGITAEELTALLWTREQLASGSIVHDQGDGGAERGFNMQLAFEQKDCGTTCCIGGWMWTRLSDGGRVKIHDVPIRMDASRYISSYRSIPLDELFHPFSTYFGDLGTEVDWEVIPVEWGVAAIDNFLATGAPNWPQVCGLVS